MAPLSVNPVDSRARAMAPLVGITIPGAPAAPPAAPPVDRFTAVSTSSPAAPAGAGITAVQLQGLLGEVEHALAEAKAEPLPTTAPALISAYWRLGNALSQGEAALIGAIDALDAGTADRPTFEAVRDRAFAALRSTGEAFAALEPALARLGGDPLIPSLPVAIEPDRGDGRPLYVYENTFKQDHPLTDAERRKQFASRVDRFASSGGKYADILLGKPGALDALPSGLRHDYLITEDGTLRMYPNPRDDKSSPRPGHSLLATGSDQYRDVRALMAGELLPLKDAGGELVALLVSNNSGHFRPAAEDLPNVLPVLEQLGVPREKVVFVAGPNNLWPIFGDLARRNRVPTDIAAAMPPTPQQVLAGLAAGLAPSAPPTQLWQ